jgi:SAM-dependent methyltransferase
MVERGPRPDGPAPREQRARRALQRQLAYQQQKARELEGREAEVIEAMRSRSTGVWAALQGVNAVPPDSRVLEVGSGAHGLVFGLESRRCVGCDPLAAEYATLFPWQRRCPTIAARGEDLPFANGTFDVVLCDNVIDHAEDPAAIVGELFRVLAPGGLLYFSVNVHHSVYVLLSRLQHTLDRLRIPIVMGAFADHTVHFTAAAVVRLFEAQPIVKVFEHHSPQAARAVARRRGIRHPGDLLKRVLFKNARYQLVGVRSDAGLAGSSKNSG